jgi:lipopolysaccharide export system protein LptC
MATRRSVLDVAIAWSPILLLASLAALTFWLDAQVHDSGVRRDAKLRHDPDLIVEGVRAVELDKNGNAVQLLSAQRARHFPDDGTVEFEDPRFTMKQPDRPKLSVAAARGRVSGDRENAYFDGGVTATRDAEGDGSDESGPIKLMTEYLHVIPKADRLQTDRPVTIEEPRGIIHADGLTLDNQAKTLKFHSKVRGTLQPRADSR